MSDVPVGPQGAMAGEVDLIGAKARWVKGTWTIKEPTTGSQVPTREWKDEPLQIGWCRNGLGYAILSRDLSLDELVSIANSLE